jgi:hypothetical protein
MDDYFKAMKETRYLKKQSIESTGDDEFVLGIIISQV